MSLFLPKKKEAFNFLLQAGRDTSQFPILETFRNRAALCPLQLVPCCDPVPWPASSGRLWNLSIYTPLNPIALPNQIICFCGLSSFPVAFLMSTFSRFFLSGCVSLLAFIYFWKRRLLFLLFWIALLMGNLSSKGL